MTTVYLARHAEVNGYFSLPPFPKEEEKGDKDPELNSEGKRNSRRLGRHLREIGACPKAIYTTPFLRGIQTAFGIKESFPNISIFQDGFLEDDPAEEPAASIVERMTSAFEYYLSKHQGKEIVIVSHGFPTALLRWRLLNPDAELINKGQLNDDEILDKAEAWKLVIDEE